jgi:hypothetical protein
VPPCSIRGLEQELVVLLPGAAAADPATAEPGVKVTRKRIDQALLWSVFALLGVAVAGYVYPPLDGDPVYWLALIVFLLPIGMAIATAIRMRRRGQPPSPSRSVLFKLSAMSLTALALVVFLNGRLDRSSVAEIHTTVAGKFVARGRFSMSYHLTVVSWRRSGREEDLRVSRHIYERADSGADISVQLHRGWFGLPWYGRIVLGPARHVPASAQTG